MFKVIYVVFKLVSQPGGGKGQEVEVRVKGDYTTFNLSLAQWTGYVTYAKKNKSTASTAPVDGKRRATVAGSKVQSASELVAGGLWFVSISPSQDCSLTSSPCI